MGMSVGLLETAETVSDWLSPPPAVMLKSEIVCRAASSRIGSGSAIAFSVGGSLIGFTVTVNVCEKLASSLFPGVPSLPASRTVTVIVAWPLRSVVGVNRSVPVLFGLVYVMVGVTSVGLFDEAVTVRACDSAAPAVMPVRLIVC